MKKIALFSALALILSLSAGTAAFAWHGDRNNNSNYHATEHSGGNNWHNGSAPAFNQHGGGHENAPNNEAIHQQELKDPRHNDNAAPAPQNNK